MAPCDAQALIAELRARIAQLTNLNDQICKDSMALAIENQSLSAENAGLAGANRQLRIDLDRIRLCIESAGWPRSHPTLVIIEAALAQSQETIDE